MNNLKSAIKYHAGCHSYNMKTVAKMLGISSSALYKKMSNPDLFRLDELMLLCKMFDTEIIFSKKGVEMKL